jgi:tripartite-type tricarboxylate transporter receptor subunit TctC
MKKLIIGLGLALGCLGASAETFPSRPLTLIVPYSAGGSSDALARALGQAVAKDTGQSVVIENRPGGSTVIGAQALQAKPADGHTALLIAASFVINPNLLKNLPYDSEKDFQAVTQLASNPHVLVVSPDVPVSNLQEFLKWARDRNNNGSFSSFGNGSSGHLGFELLKKRAELDMLHVPYKGAAPSTMAVLSGEVHATLGDVGVVAPHILAGKLKAIAVTGSKRAPSLPDVPTFAEGGLSDFSSETWMGLLVKADSPQDRVQRLNELFKAALAQPEVQAILTQQGMEAKPSTPDAFRSFMAAEGAKYKRAIEESNVRID